MENDLYQVISVLHRGDKTCVDVDGLFEPRYRYRNSKRSSLLFLGFGLIDTTSKEVPVSALGWGLCTWFAALLVRVPLSIGASDLTGLSIGASNLIELAAEVAAEVDSSGRRSGFEIGVTFYFQPFILMGYDSICRRGFQTP